MVQSFVELHANDYAGCGEDDEKGIIKPKRLLLVGKLNNRTRAHDKG